MKLSALVPGSTDARAAGVVLVIILIVVAFLGVRSCASAPARRDAAQAKVGEAVARGTAGAAKDATAITGNTMDHAAAIDRQTETNHDAIHSAPGATVAVDPGVSDAGLRALCMRRAYHDQPRCVALLKPGAVAAK